MVRAIPFVLLVVIVAAILAVRPDLPFRWAARLWYDVALHRAPAGRVPGWVSHYLWAAPGDPVSGTVVTMEESVRAVALVLFAVLVLLAVLVILAV